MYVCMYVRTYVRMYVCMYVCVTHLYRCKTSITLYIYLYAGGHRGPGGVGDQMKTPPWDPCKRTRRTSVVHLGAFKSQLVATVVLYIYIYIYIYVCIHPYLHN